MSRTIHMCVSVRGMLNWSLRETKRNMVGITDSTGARYTDVYAFRNALMDELAQGHEVIPMGEACEGFDYKKGCPGHEKSDAA